MHFNRPLAGFRLTEQSRAAKTLALVEHVDSRRRRVGHFLVFDEKRGRGLEQRRVEPVILPFAIDQINQFLETGKLRLRIARKHLHVTIQGLRIAHHELQSTKRRLLRNRHWNFLNKRRAAVWPQLYFHRNGFAGPDLALFDPSVVDRRDATLWHRRDANLNPRQMRKLVGIRIDARESALHRSGDEEAGGNWRVRRSEKVFELYGRVSLDLDRAVERQC